jgi:hypothetical protein
MPSVLRAFASLILGESRWFSKVDDLIAISDFEARIRSCRPQNWKNEPQIVLISPRFLSDSSDRLLHPMGESRMFISERKKPQPFLKSATSCADFNLNQKDINHFIFDTNKI